MTHHLVVTKPFLNFVRGDIIIAATMINNILSSEYKKFVTKVTASNVSEG